MAGNGSVEDLYALPDEPCAGCGGRAPSAWICPHGIKPRNLDAHVHRLCLLCAEYVGYDDWGVLVSCPGEWTDADRAMIALARGD